VTLAVLEGLRRLEAPPVLGFASSAAVYGNGSRMPMKEDHPLQPMSPYGVAKLAAEHYVRLYSGLYGLPAFSARIFSLYGPRQRKQVVYDLLTRAFAGQEPLSVLGSPDVTRDFVFAEDAARGILTLAREAPAAGEAYNLASGRGTALRDVVAGVLEAAELRVPTCFTGRVRPGDPTRWEGDPTRAEALGVRCRIPLDEGLRRTTRWFVESEARAFA
jgi:UDP-glucose 4-epimerase